MPQHSPRFTDRARQVPKPPRAHLAREALLDALLANDYRLNLLYGPAGSGKTTLMADCARRAGVLVEVVWLDLHGRQLDRASFFALLHQALTGAACQAEQQLVEVLYGRERPLWIMLDDFPRAPDSPVDAALAQLLGIQNDNLRWWVAARRRPQCGLPRLLLENQLQALGPESLFFSRDEIAALLVEHGCDDEDQALRLLERTHGWCAAVIMESLLNAQQHPQARAAARENILAEYLNQELLAELPPALTEALPQLALLPQFNRALCAHALPGEGSAQAFDALLERDLLAPRGALDCRWYAVIPAIAECLAGQVEPACARALHLRACQWLEEAGELRLAIDQAMAAGQPAKAAQLLERLGNSQIFDANQAFKVLEWSRNLPAQLLNSTPDLVIVNALSQAMAMQADEARRSLEHLGAFLPAPTAERQQRLLAAAQAVLALTDLARGDAIHAEENGRQALAHLTDNDWVLRRSCSVLLARLHLFFGELGATRQIVQAELKQIRPLDIPTAEALVELYQAEQLEIEGELPHARQILERSWSRLKNASYHETGIAARLQLQLGRLMLCQGLLSLAEQHFAQGYQLALAFYDPTAFLDLVGLAQIAILNEESSKAEALLNQAEQLAQRRRLAEGVYRTVIDLGRARVCILRQELPRAERLLRAVLNSYPPLRGVCQAYCNHGMLFECERLLAVIDLLKGEHELAASRLERTLARANGLGFRTQACEAKLALALNALLANNTRDAAHWLQRGLQDAEAMDFLLPVERLRRTRPELFELVAETRNSGLLSEREVEVLELVAAGHSNQEIAERLFISVFTVKSHVQRLSMKLEVKRRTQAVAKAKSLGILR